MELGQRLEGWDRFGDWWNLVRGDKKQNIFGFFKDLNKTLVTFLTPTVTKTNVQENNTFVLLIS